MKGRVAYNCSFCGKAQERVHRLIAGPGGVYICNECISLCTEIIAEEQVVRQDQTPKGDAQWVKSSGARKTDDEVVERVAQAAAIDRRVQALLAPLVDELAAARATIERLADENGALRERTYLRRDGDKGDG